MSILSKKPRHEVISVRLNEDRLKLLERYQKLLTDQLGRPVSLGEAAFLVIEERVVGMDREASRHEMLRTPTESLYRIRKKWESQHSLVRPNGMSSHSTCRSALRKIPGATATSARYSIQGVLSSAA